MSSVITWWPKASLIQGSSVRLLDIEPDLTIENATGSAIFSVAGSLKRTGTDNGLYQWTGYYLGTRLESEESAICRGGTSDGETCTEDGACPEVAVRAGARSTRMASTTRRGASSSAATPSSTPGFRSAFSRRPH